MGKKNGSSAIRPCLFFLFVCVRNEIALYIFSLRLTFWWLDADNKQRQYQKENIYIFGKGNFLLLLLLPPPTIYRPPVAFAGFLFTDFVCVSLAVVDMSCWKQLRAYSLALNEGLQQQANVCHFLLLSWIVAFEFLLIVRCLSSNRFLIKFIFHVCDVVDGYDAIFGQDFARLSLRPVIHLYLARGALCAILLEWWAFFF